MSTLAIPTERPSGRFGLYCGLVVLLVLVMWASLSLGYRLYSPADLWAAFTGTAELETLSVLRDLRLPRAVIAPLVGAALGVAGVIVETLARNRIAAPDTLGLNSGAAFAVVAASLGFGVSSLVGLSAAAALGALLTSFLVFGLAAAAGGLSPLRIVLIGVTMSGLFAALVDMVLTVREAELEQLLFWLAGSIVDRPLSLAAIGAPAVFVGLLLAFWLAPALDIMQTDDSTAKSLGLPVALVRIVSFIAIALLTGAAVAMAGPIAFVGLVVPHAARWLAGLRHTHQIAAAALVGAIYVTAADIASRFVIFPTEAPVGAVTAVLGGFVLVVLLKRRAA